MSDRLRRILVVECVLEVVEGQVGDAVLVDARAALLLLPHVVDGATARLALQRRASLVRRDVVHVRVESLATEGACAHAAM
eukprot:826625-Pleurochrysis_carterae.AAC.14